MQRVLLPLVMMTSTVLLTSSAVAQEKNADNGNDQKKPAVRPLTAEAMAKMLIFSKETTRVTEHKTKSGLPDYAAAINAHFGKGVEPSENGAVSLYQALGPEPEGVRLSDEFFAALGMPVPPDDGDYFQPFGAAIPAEDRPAALDEFDQAMERPWTEDEFPRVAKWLKDNEAPVAIVVAGASRPAYYSPLVPPVDEHGVSEGLISTLLPGIQQSRSVARYLICRVMLNIQRGRADEAWNDLIACHRFGHMISKGPTLIDFLVGTAINGIASKGDLIYLDRIPMDAKRVAQCRRDLAALPPLPTVVDQLDLTERMMFLDGALLIGCGRMDAMAMSSGPETGLEKFITRLAMMSVDWNATMRTGNEQYDRMVAAMKLESYQQRQTAIATLEDDLKKMKANISFTGFLKATATEGSGRAAVGKMMGDILSSLLLPACGAVNKAHNRSEQTRQNLTVAFALTDWKLKHGSYPDSLENLVPDYLERPPADLFNGKPLNYQKTDDGFLIYSVGANHEDESGRSFDDDPPGDDLAVHIPLPAAQEENPDQ